MAIVGTLKKQPGETLDYDFDYTKFFSIRSDTPLSATYENEDGITVTPDSQSGNFFKIKISGGNSGSKYKITIKMTTSNGIIKEDEIIVTVLEV